MVRAKFRLTAYWVAFESHWAGPLRGERERTLGFPETRRGRKREIHS